MPSRKIDIAGQRFGGLVAVRSTTRTKGSGYLWLFRCDCGNHVERRPGTVRSAAQDGRLIRCDECRSRNDYVNEGAQVTLDVSTRKYPSVWCRVDAEDLDLLQETGGKWFVARAKTGLFYVYSNIERNKGVSLHRLLMDAPPDKEVDHIDGDPLNNRKSNLRLVTREENRKNMATQRRSLTGVSGVTKSFNKFQVTISGKHIGSFDSLDEAVRVRKALEREYGYHENHGRHR